MPRYVGSLPIAIDPERATAIISEYLQSEGFKLVTEKTEVVWRKGGTLGIPQFVKAEAAEGSVHLEAWVAEISIVPGVYFGEQGLEGRQGFAVKNALARRLKELERLLTA